MAAGRAARMVVLESQIRGRFICLAPSGQFERPAVIASEAKQSPSMEIAASLRSSQ
jgi:hypothetical protein